jgi:hypothetical protein
MEKKAGVGPIFGCEVVAPLEAQNPCTASTTLHQTRKRKIACALTGAGTVDKENLVVFSNDIPVATKRICREKTGTDWQTVLDVIAYGEERNRRQTQDTTVTVEKK